MLLKYQGIIKIVFILSLFLSPVCVYAQTEPQDTIRSITSEMNADTVIQEGVKAPPDEIVQEPDVYEGYQETPRTSGSVYFLSKSWQSNNGIPDSVQARKIPDTTARNLRQEEDFWYVNYEFDKKARKEKENKKEKKSSTPFTETSFFQTLLWLVIIGGFTSFVILYLSNSNVNLFSRRNRSLVTDDGHYVETDNIFEINYQREIDKAVDAGNYRFAIRLLFLRALKNMSDKKVIEYKQDKTNFDYLSQIHSTKYYPDFFRLTLNYEYSWYGQFDIDAEKYSIIKSDFEKFDRNLK